MCYLLVAFFFPISFGVFSQFQPISNLELPETADTNEWIRHPGFTLLYNEQHEQASWVAYLHTRQKLVKNTTRTDRFLPDPKVATASANAADYKGSGYDRGHLAPAADMSWSEASMAASFYFSNMSPQVPAFNRGIWKQCEELVRDWTEKWDSVYVATGPVLRKGLPYIGENKVSVPESYFKVLLHYSHSKVMAIGFVIPNESSSRPLYDFVVTVDSVETLTGLNFFSALPDSIQTKVEQQKCFNCWDSQQEKMKTDDVSKPVEHQSCGVQCSATTQKGVRCKRMTFFTNGRCHQHGGE